MNRFYPLSLRFKCGPFRFKCGPLSWSECRCISCSEFTESEGSGNLVPASKEMRQKISVIWICYAGVQFHEYLVCCDIADCELCFKIISICIPWFHIESVSRSHQVRMVIDGRSVGYVFNNLFKACLVVGNHPRGVDCLCSAAVWKRAELSRIKQNSIART